MFHATPAQQRVARRPIRAFGKFSSPLDLADDAAGVAGLSFRGVGERSKSIAQLDIPVREVEKVPPAIVQLAVESDVDERPPLRTHGLFNKLHPDLMREPVSLPRITSDARAHDVFPCRRPALIARDDVIEIEIALVENAAAILAGVLVALENVVTRELHLLARHPVEKHQHDHARHADFERDRMHHFLLRLAGGKAAPALEIVCQEIVPSIGVHHLRVPLAQEGKSPAHCADVNRLPESVQNENLAVEHMEGPGALARKVRGS